MSSCATLTNKENYTITGGFDGTLYTWDSSGKVLHSQEKAH